MADKKNEKNSDDVTKNDLPSDSEVLAIFKRIANAVGIAMEAACEGVDNILHAMENFQEDFKNRNSNASNNDVPGNVNSEGTAADNKNDDTNSLQSLLSAEIVLPIVKALLEKFTKYVEENGEIMPTEDKERFAKQLELYKMIESIYETGKSDGTLAGTEEGSKIVLDVMRKLRGYGEPLKGILDSFEALLHITDDSGAEPQCPTM